MGVVFPPIAGENGEEKDLGWEGHRGTQAHNIQTYAHTDIIHTQHYKGG